MIFDVNDFFIELWPEEEFPAPEAPIAFAGLFHGEWYGIDYDGDWWTTSEEFGDPDSEWFPFNPGFMFHYIFMDAIQLAIERNIMLN